MSFGSEAKSLVYLQPNYENLSIMIQRVQSIYLGLAFICVALLLYFPIMSIAVEFESLVDMPRYYSELGPNGFTTDELEAAGVPVYWGYLFLGSITLLCLVSYKNRKRQIFICRLNLVLHLLLAASFYWVYYGARPYLLEALDIKLEDEVTITFAMKLGFYLLSATIPLLLLAIRGIKNDEKLVKSLDRLR